jgi:hypothetical protein
MVGLINQMAAFAYGDVQRTEARQAPTIEEIEDARYDEEELDLILDRDLLERLYPVLNERERLIIDRSLEGVSDADIASELDVDPNNLHQIRWRAHKRLRAEAEQRLREAFRLVRPRLPAGNDYVLVVRSGLPPQGAAGAAEVEEAIVALAARVLARRIKAFTDSPASTGSASCRSSRAISS